MTMIDDVPVLVESKRGCGFRKKGGLYLMGGELVQPCGKLPLVVGRCPTCGEGIRQARGWTWIRPRELWGAEGCDNPAALGCSFCWCGGAIPETAGLLWIGERFYPTPGDFTKESLSMGISRRISAIPRDFVVGETVIFLGHPKTVRIICECRTELKGAAPDCQECGGFGELWEPAIFAAFRPHQIQKVVDEQTPAEEIEALRKRGITPVIVKPQGGPTT
jgi:hypothetical protein